jgi:hypothetical protein
MKDLDQLLELAYDQVRARIEDFTPADLNALIKNIHTVKREEPVAPPTLKPVSNITDFLAKHQQN